MRRSILVFVSGKYSGDIEDNIAFAKTFAENLWDNGYTAICPHLNTAKFNEEGKTKWHDYLAGDIVILERCDALLALPNWKESDGSQVEIEKAYGLDIPVFESVEMMNLYFGLENEQD